MTQLKEALQHDLIWEREEQDKKFYESLVLS